MISESSGRGADPARARDLALWRGAPRREAFTRKLRAGRAGARAHVRPRPRAWLRPSTARRAPPRRGVAAERGLLPRCGRALSRPRVRGSRGRHPPPANRRVGPAGLAGAADGRRRIPAPGDAGSALEQSGRRPAQRAARHLPRAVVPGPSRRLERGRSCLLSSRREQGRRGTALRVLGHLYDAPVEQGPAAAPPPRTGRARLCLRQGRPPVPPAPRAARFGKERPGEGAGRRREVIPHAGLDTRRGAPVLARGARLRGGGHRRPRS